jgi:hypothetical protein
MLLRSDGTGAMRAPCELSCAPAFESKRLAPDMCLLKYQHDLPTGELATRRIKNPPTLFSGVLPQVIQAARPPAAAATALRAAHPMAFPGQGWVRPRR